MNLTKLLNEAFDGAWSKLVKDWCNAGLDGMAGMFFRHAQLFAIVDDDDATLLFVVRPELAMYADHAYVSKAEKFIHEVTADRGWKIVVYVGYMILNDQPSKSYDWFMMPIRKTEYRHRYSSVSA